MSWLLNLALLMPPLRSGQSAASGATVQDRTSPSFGLLALGLMDTASALETPPVDVNLPRQPLGKIGVADMKRATVRTLIGDDERPGPGAGEFRLHLGRLPTAIRDLSIASLGCWVGRLLSHLGIIILRTFTTQTREHSTGSAGRNVF